MLLAATRELSPVIGRCVLTHAPRVPIDVDRARAQHRAYETALERAGCVIVHIEAAPALPDSVFVEDLAVVLDEVAVVTRPGAPSRRPEIDGVARLLARYRPLAAIDAPGTLDGGDVLVVGRTLYVGMSGRTNAAAAAQLRTIVAPHGYTVREVAVTGCLHLKSAVTRLTDGRLLANRAWIDAAPFAGETLIEVDPSEPDAANVVTIGGTLIYPAAFPHTRGRLERLGYQVHAVEVSEIAKAEGAVTCCSLIFHSADAALGRRLSDS
jgi:dimethylargininase